MAGAEVLFKASVLDQPGRHLYIYIYIDKASNTTISSHLMTACAEHLHSQFLSFPTTIICLFILSPSSEPLLKCESVFCFSAMQGQINEKGNTLQC